MTERTTIDRLIVNSPYEEPQRYWRYNREKQTFTLVEADAMPEASAVAVLDMQIPPGNGQVYRALPVRTLFGEVPGK